MAVSKTRTAEEVAEVAKSGLRRFGENRVQEAAAKIPRVTELLGPGVEWHLVGTLQRNKLKAALELFAILESVDSLRLSWTLLKERHGNDFHALEPRYTTDMSGSEQTYDLIVGPVASVDDAKRLCQELAMKATPCKVSHFTGDAL